MITCKQYPEILFLCFFMTICCLGNPIVTEDSESSAITNGVRCIIFHDSRHGISFVTDKNQLIISAKIHNTNRQKIRKSKHFRIYIIAIITYLRLLGDTSSDTHAHLSYDCQISFVRQRQFQQSNTASISKDRTRRHQ